MMNRVSQPLESFNSFFSKNAQNQKNLPESKSDDDLEFCQDSPVNPYTMQKNFEEDFSAEKEKEKIIPEF